MEPERMNTNRHDIEVLRGLAQQYAEIAAKDLQQERRDLWRQHFSLSTTRVPILVTYGIWNVWCQDVFADQAMRCEDPFHRQYERWLRMELFHDSIGDDYICEPWLPLAAVRKTAEGAYGEAWGARVQRTHAAVKGGSWKATPPIASWDDMEQLSPPVHAIDEEATCRNAARLQDAIGDILEVDIQRGPILSDFAADISTTVAGLRGLEQIMIDMYESPEELHSLLAFLRDGVLANQEQAEAAGDLSLTTQRNQAMPYAKELESPKPNSGSRKRNELWGSFAAQEYTLVSPKFHEEFLLRYQAPIMDKYALVHYGCCENLTRKIDMLRSIPNLRSIAVTPTADVVQCADQIGSDYVISWRPNPTDMVCTNWDESRIERQLRDGLQACQNGVCHIRLKDIETLQGEPDRLRRWTRIARSVVEEM